MTHDFAIVVAMDDERGIGRGGQLPWHLPGDLAQFRRVTRGSADSTSAVIMGRRTWDSLPPRFRPLPGRLNVVMSRQSQASVSSGDMGSGRVIWVGSLVEALSGFSSEVDRVFVIGGGQIYAEALIRPECRELFVTHVQGTYGCDVHFPAFAHQFEEAETSALQGEEGARYRFAKYRRR